MYEDRRRRKLRGRIVSTETAASLIGAPRSSAPTPALILDLPKAQRNIEEMAHRMAPLPAGLRPHAKIHKSPVLGMMQLNAGAIGLTTATIWEASAMVAAGIDDILVANQVVGPFKAAELARLSGQATVIAAVDSHRNADELAAAAVAAGTEISVIVEYDVGLHRSGTRTHEAAITLASHIQRLRGLKLLGVLGYEGHCMLEPDREIRIEKTLAANAALIALVDEFERRQLPTEIVAAGGLGTWDITGANARITEIHAGSYIFMDAFHRNLVPGFEVALTVLGTVISRDGSMAVLDVGRKAIGIDRAVPELVNGEAVVRYEHGEHFIHEEHTAIILNEGAGLDVGDRVEVMSGYAPTTVNLYDIFYVVDGNRIIDVWPIAGRYGSATVGEPAEVAAIASRLAGRATEPAA
jgi:D-serine deaminase-like pyridoxal phosphate-dependent protein